MKIKLFVALLFIANFSLLAQDCPPYSITFSTQEQLDQFIIQYPNCTELDVDISINAHGNFDYSPLNNIEKTRRWLYINTFDFDVTGLLNNLKSVRGIDVNSSGSELSLINSFNELDSIKYRLTLSSSTDEWSKLNLDAFRNLRSVGANLGIKKLKILDSINIFNKLTEAGSLYFVELQAVTSRFRIYGFENLERTDYMWFRDLEISSLPGFENLVSVYDKINLENAINTEVFDGFNSLVAVSEINFKNNNIKKLKGFNNLQELDGGIQLYKNEVDELDAFNSIVQINGPISIHEDKLTDFKGFSSLKVINNTLFLTGFKSKSIEAFNNLSKVTRYIDIREADSLLSLDFLSNLKNLSHLSIMDNRSLRDFSGLENITHFAGYLKVHHNASLTSFKGLDNLEFIGGICNILSNQSLSSLSGLGNVKEIKGDFTLINNWGISNLDHLSSLESVGSLIIESNKYLKHVNGLEKLKKISEVTGSVVFRDNSSLKSLEGLENLNDTIVNVYINKNDSLENISALSGLSIVEKAGSNLVIMFNPRLPTCSHDNICRAIFHVYNVYISHNGEDCSKNYLKTHCEYIGLDETIENSAAKIYYDSHSSTIAIKLDSKEKVKAVHIYNSVGQIVYSSDNDSNFFKIPSFSPGIYVIMVITAEGMISNKIYIY